MTAMSPARAGQDELALSAGPTWSVALLGAVRPAGYGGAVDVHYGLDDTWGISAGSSAAHHPPDGEHGAFDVAVLTAGVTYTVDVLVVVPTIRLDAAAYLARRLGITGSQALDRIREAAPWTSPNRYFRDVPGSL